MKTGPFLTPSLILIGLTVATANGFFTGRPFLNLMPVLTIGMPLLSRPYLKWNTVDQRACPEFKGLPAGMCEEEVLRQFVEALGYIHPGSWIFDVTLNSQIGN